MAAPKLIHRMAHRQRGHFNAKAACGRLVNWMFTSDNAESVTCDKCHRAMQREAVETLLATLTPPPVGSDFDDATGNPPFPPAPR